MAGPIPLEWVRLAAIAFVGLGLPAACGGQTSAGPPGSASTSTTLTGSASTRGTSTGAVTSPIASSATTGVWSCPTSTCAPGYVCTPPPVVGGAEAGGNPCPVCQCSLPASTPDDASNLACFSSTGVVLPALKTCASDSDCTYVSHLTDCCGATLMVGVSTAQAAREVACERVWSASLVGCNNCVPSLTAEDGKSELDGGELQVHCIPTDGGSQCETSVH
jgi:hypothetical protein